MLCQGTPGKLGGFILMIIIIERDGMHGKEKEGGVREDNYFIMRVIYILY
jgi:hypothetical protein